jgi:hypothetical protein
MAIKRSLTVCISCGLLIAFSVDAQPLLFLDDFNDGNAMDGVPGTWVPVVTPSGMRIATSGDFTLSHNSQIGAELQELSDARDVSMRTQVNFPQPSGRGDFASVWARNPIDSNSAAYWGGIRTGGFLGIGRTNSNGTDTIFSTASTSLDAITRDVLLRFDVVGNRISLFAWQDGQPMPTSPQLTAVDNLLTAGGQLGLTLTPNLDGGSSPAAAVFRYYAVTIVPEPSAFLLACIAAIRLTALRRRPRVLPS